VSAKPTEDHCCYVVQLTKLAQLKPGASYSCQSDERTWDSQSQDR